jgi:hypothetical protein
MSAARNFPALGFDPTPGDVSQTRDLGRSLGDMSTELGTILSNITGADRGSWQGQSANAFMDHLNGDLKPAVQKCHDSFQQASSLLYNWAGQLDGFQAEAAGLEQQAEHQQSTVNSAKTTVHGQPGQPGQPAAAAAGSPQATQQAADATKNQQALTDAQSGMSDLIRRAHDLHDRFNSAAQAIADQLHHAGQMAPGKPGLFDSIVDGIGKAFSGAWHWVEAHADAIKFIGDLLSDLSGILGILAIITAPFEPLGAIFAVAAVATSAAACLTHLLAKAAGANVSWMSIGMDALGALPGIGAFAKGAKVADGAVAVARAGELGEGFRGVTTLSHGLVGLGHDASALKNFSAFGKTVAVWGTKAGGFISHDGSFLGRAQMIVEQAYRPGQLLGSKGLNMLGDGVKVFGKELPKFSIDAMSGLGRTIDAGIKVAPKLYFLPHGVHNDMEMNAGSPFHAMFG